MALLIRNVHPVRGHAAPLMQRGGACGDPSGGDGAVVRGVHVHADGHAPALPGVRKRRDASDGFDERERGPAVEGAEGLFVAGHGHGRGGVFGAPFEGDAQALRQGAEVIHGYP
nr:hypothetical protein [Corynebacterium renale]